MDDCIICQWRRRWNAIYERFNKDNPHNWALIFTGRQQKMDEKYLICPNKGKYDDKS